MLDFRFETDKHSGETVLVTSEKGKSLLTIPQLNKGTAFTQQERIDFDLLGKLPPRVETLEEQVQRSYKQYQSYESKLQRNIYLNNLHDKNQVLFYKLVSEHLQEMMPTIYTPIVGTAVKKYSQEFRQPRGLYIAYPDRAYIEKIIDSRSNPEIDLIVITDGEGVLGIGDQGIGGMDIPIAKLMVYSLLGGINPCRTLPICLDIGTNNETLLNDPMYLGWQYPRISGKDYDDFVSELIDVLKRKFPHVFLHWEDFGRANARRFLEKFKYKICTFNDDIQGTGAVALAGIMAALAAKNSHLSKERIVIYGAGTAGIGIADQIYDAMINYQGITPEKARQLFWLIDKEGLLFEDIPNLTPGQQQYARARAEWPQTDAEHPVTLLDVIKKIKPTILIGCSGRKGAFDHEIITTLYEHEKQPIIFPLSNPTECAEAEPQDLLSWTEGNALIATGTPFDDVTYNGHTQAIAQCNNALVFPGIGLGIIAIKARRLSNQMMWAATQALSECSPLVKQDDLKQPLLPLIDQGKKVAKYIALRVAEQAIQEDLHDEKRGLDDLEALIEKHYWEARYIPFKRKSK